LKPFRKLFGLVALAVALFLLAVGGGFVGLVVLVVAVVVIRNDYNRP
jgi:thiol:disulfide interchange protein